MLKRQQLILKLIEQAGGQIEKIRLVKMAFLISQHFKEFPKSLNYDFLPYLHGPFSFTLYHEIENLERNGYIDSDDKTITITPLAGNYNWTLEYKIASQVKLFSKQLHSTSTNTLINKIYHQYPWFTLNSVTKKDTEVFIPKVKNSVFTIGYEGLMVDAFINLLLKHGVQQLIDVRCNPITRKYGFHKSTLNRICSKLNIQYIHIPELGIPSLMRANLSSQSSYIALFQKYSTEILPYESEAIIKVKDLILTRPSVLMCMEADPKCCHRTTLGKLIATQLEIPLIDLRTDI